MDQVTGRLEKPRQGWAGLWNISFGFFGIQIGFALQNANMSRVFQSLGASLDDLPALWVAAPLTGLLVQPIIGFMSDRTWLGRFGRRRPYFVAGALLAALSLLLMPLAPVLLAAAALLWMLDASLNISMEPFRAFVGDQLRSDQHTAGYAVQTAFIGAGAVIGSIFPYLLEHWGVSNVAAGGAIPDTVKWSFWAGGAALFLAVMWTVLTTREYSPEQMLSFGEAPGHALDDSRAALASRSMLVPLRLGRGGRAGRSRWCPNSGSRKRSICWAPCWWLMALLSAFADRRRQARPRARECSAAWSAISPACRR